MPSPWRKAFFEAYHRTTAGRTHPRERFSYRQVASGLGRRLKPWLPRDRSARCVDLGCGCGDLLFYLEQEGYTQVTGVDFCREELAQAGRFVQCRLVEADLLDYLRACPSASVDWMSALNVLEHFPKDEMVEMMKEIRRVLRPGGQLVLMVPNALSPWAGATRYWDLTHEAAFTPNNFRQWAAWLNFSSRVEFREVRPVVHGVFSAARALLWQALRVLAGMWLLVETGSAKDGIYTMDMLVRLQVPERS